jgi:hypothetical protein
MTREPVRRLWLILRAAIHPRIDAPNAASATTDRSVGVATNAWSITPTPHRVGKTRPQSRLKSRPVSDIAPHTVRLQWARAIDALFRSSTCDGIAAGSSVVSRTLPLHHSLDCMLRSTRSHQSISTLWTQTSRNFAARSMFPRSFQPGCGTARARGATTWRPRSFRWPDWWAMHAIAVWTASSGYPTLTNRRG